MIKYKAHIKATIFILSILGLFGFANHRNSNRIITNIQVEFEQGDNLFITDETVNNLLIQSFGNLKNKSKENIFLKVIEEKVEENEMIENAEVYLSINGTLKTKITQRKPIARIQVNGSAYYLDSKGKKMPLSENYSARVPIIIGVQSDLDLKLVYQFCNTVLKDAFMEKQIIGIQVKKNELELKTRLGNQVILFGNLSKSELKIKKLKAFYQKVIADETLKKYSKINLKFKDQVVCTKKS